MQKSYPDDKILAKTKKVCYKFVAYKEFL